MSNLSDEALGKITTILAPYLTRSLNIVGNPMPEIKKVLGQLEAEAYRAGWLDSEKSNHEANTCFSRRVSHD